MTQHVKEFDGKKMINITKDNTLFQEKNEDYENHLCKKMKELLEVEKVVVSSRLGISLLYRIGRIWLERQYGTDHESQNATKQYEHGDDDGWEEDH